MRRILPKTMLGQLVIGIVMVQTVMLAIFITYTIRTTRNLARQRGRERALQQVDQLSRLSSRPLAENRRGDLQIILEEARITPTIDTARITDLNGATLAVTATGQARLLSAEERAELSKPLRARTFLTAENQTEAVGPIYADGKPIALLWLEPNHALVGGNAFTILGPAMWYGALALLANLLPIFLVVRAVTRPLRRLREATQQIVRNPENSSGFPLPVTTFNEVGELTRSFNTMVRELEEQRSGLYETLALLDSMLGNAPIGFAFYDRKLRYVRLNQFLADVNGLPINRHLGRRMSELYPGPLADDVERLLEQVFVTGESVRDFEMKGELPSKPSVFRSWICSFYPVRTSQDSVRWVGVIVVEITERLLAEETLRKSEKLAAAGRLAASIAHEINNPLEAVTNLLYLLRTHPGLDEMAQEYTVMAQQELARVSEITQQTLRFYRQSTYPVQTNIAEVLNSVLKLHQSRIHAAHVTVIRKFRDSATIFGFAGELRQLFANLIGNAIDAMPQGGRLLVAVRATRGRCSEGIWREGVRITVADTGTGMSEETRRRIFEPFFTTKDATGTGLGLWVSDEIVRKHSGRVRVKSRQGEPSGTTFSVFFPHDGLKDGRVFLSDDPSKESANA